MPFCVDVSPDASAIGGKARSLARLDAAGLSIPAGFAITSGLYDALRASGPPLPAELAEPGALAALDAAARALATAPFPAGFENELAARLRALGAKRVCVRSSFAAEDDPTGVAAGVFRSHIDIPAAEAAAAVRDVLASALSPAAMAYAGRHATPGGPAALLVHAFVAGEAAGSAALDPAACAEPAIDATAGTLLRAARDAIAAALRTLAARHGAVEIEWVATGDRVTFLQLRPWRPPAPPRAWSAAVELGPGRWRWDAEHNPLPLSPAQTGLVRLVDERCRTGVEQRVAGGYLFVAPGSRTLADAATRADARGIYDELRAAAEAGLAALGDPPPLDGALDLFCAVYEPLFGALQPALRQARAALEAFLQANLPAALPRLPEVLAGARSVAAERQERAARIAAAPPDARAQAVADYLARFGDEAPAWDVAVATLREDAAALETPVRDSPRASPAPADQWRRAGDAIGEALAPGARLVWRRLLTLARDAVELGEEDDWLYARVQAAVRRSLLAFGTQLAAAGLLDSGDDVFFLPFPLARSLAAGARPPTDLRAQAVAGRSRWKQARLDPPPIDEAFSGAPGLVRGIGTGGRAVGRVWQPGHGAPPPGAIMVCRTLLPTELPLVEPAAVVVETGGPLDHVAAQARERGIPALVRALGACERLPAGEPVLVDADAGVALALNPRR